MFIITTIHKQQIIIKQTLIYFFVGRPPSAKRSKSKNYNQTIVKGCIYTNYILDA
jgi:hypothetical protein